MIRLTLVQKLHLFLVCYNVYILYFLLLQKRWKILQDHIHNLSLKSLSQTRWESCIESVKVVRFQLVEVSDDPKIKSEIDCLTTYELENFVFVRHEYLV